MNKTVCYMRVSTNHQTTDNQLVALQDYSKRMGLEISNIYKDEGISGVKGQDKRPALNQLMKDVVKGKFNRILIYDISRLGRSMKDLINILNDLKLSNVNITFLNQGIDTATSTGQLMFSLLGIFAEYERNIMIDRVKTSLARRKEQGVKLGRPSQVNNSLVTAVDMLRDKGYGIRKIATQLKIGVGTVYKILNTEPQVEIVGSI